MEKLLQRKNKILQIIEKNCSDANSILYLLIKNNHLDNIIANINDKVSIPNVTSIVKKGYLTSEEQFVEVACHIIHRINMEFCFLSDRNLIIEFILNYKETLPLLLTKKYVGNNRNIPYFTFYIKRACVSNFYNILKFIDKNELIDNFLSINKINLKKCNIDSKKDVEKLFNILKIICLCNINSFHSFYLFDNRMDERNKDMYEIQLEILIENTIKNQEIAKKFIEIM